MEAVNLSLISLQNKAVITWIGMWQLSGLQVVGILR